MRPAGGRIRILAPHAEALVGMDWSRLNWCGTPTTPTPRFVLRFPEGVTVSGMASGLTLPGCGLGSSILEVSGPVTGN